MKFLKAFKELPDEKRFVAAMVVLVVIGTIILVLLNKYGRLSEAVLYRDEKKKEKTVIVSDADKNVILSAQPKKVVGTAGEAARQDPMSTVHLQLSRAPQGSPEYEALKHEIETDAKIRRQPGIEKVKPTSNAPLRYIDKSTPRDKSVDALYLYLVEIGGGTWPRFCVQTAGKKAVRAEEFSLTIDGRSHAFKQLPFKTEKLGKGVAEYYDVPLTPQIFRFLETLPTARTAKLTITGPDGTRSREITDDEKSGIARIMDTYVALGRTFAYLRESAPTGSTGNNKRNKTP